MDNIFKKYAFIHVYVDDILITSNNIAQHIIHLNTFADVCIQHGLALLEKKAKIRLQIIAWHGNRWRGSKTPNSYT